MDKFSAILSEEMLVGPSYEPPYDSPIEEQLAWDLVKYLRVGVKFDRQVDVRTQCGTYRMDFVCNAGGRSVGIECDGQDYHDAERDEWRDALIMATGRVNAIYRLKGCDIFSEINRVLYLVSLCEESLFSDRGRISLKVLGEGDMISIVRDDTIISIEYRWYPEELAHLLDDQDLHDQAAQITDLFIVRYIDRGMYGREPRWLAKAHFASQHRGKTLREIMSLYSLRNNLTKLT
jgi:very-short-patch-repair endonuclease